MSEAEGSRSEGFRMNVLPQASAIGNIHSGTIAGKLNGVMPATTPSGWRREKLSTPRPTWSLNSPFSRSGMPVANSTTSRPRVTSPAASERTLPCSAVMMAASSLAFASSSSRKRNMTRARASGVAAAHSGRAAVAARTAASTSAREPSATLRATAPVAGLNTSPNRPPPLIRCPPITCCTI